MRRLSIVCLLLGLTAPVFGQRGPQGEVQIYYQRIQDFDFNSGSQEFILSGESLNGGGFGFIYSVNRWFGIWSQSTFFGGVEQNQISLNLINQMQGAVITARGVGPLNVFAKAGVGFTRHVFEFPLGEGVTYGTAFAYGGGLGVPVREGLFWIVDLSQLAVSLPELTNSPDRDKWDRSLLLTTGIAFQF